jgi:hypothetical protein
VTSGTASISFSEWFPERDSVEAPILTVMEPRSQRRVARNRKKNRVPLSKLRTSEVVRTVVDHPRRLGELLNLLEDRDRTVRGRAAATLARLSESHPGRLVSSVERLADNLADDAAYVRWHLAYALGRIGWSFPNCACRFLSSLSGRLDDHNRVVRVLSCSALERIAARKPEVVQQAFESVRKEAPASVARYFPDAK